MHDMKKWKSILFCFCFLIAAAMSMSGCGKKEELTLSEIDGQRSDLEVSGSEDVAVLEEEDASGRESDDSKDSGKADETQGDSGVVCVYVCGRVNRPGVYELPHGSRICDGIEAAGGMKEDGASDYLNQAELLEDGERVYVPSEEEAKQLTDPSDLLQHGGDTSSDASGKVSINSAGKEELMTLSGIGASKAEAIIRYREANNGFSSVEELMQVEGIKEGTFEKIRNDITL